jgi:PAS domain S-box-containing protein
LRRQLDRYHSPVRAVPVFADDGSIREWAGIHSDITQRKLTEQSLRDGERRFRELADAMPQIVWASRPDGHFDYFNHRWYEFTGRSEEAEDAEEAANWADVVHPDDQEEALERWQAAIKSGNAYEIEYRLRGKDGEYRWYLTRALPIRDRSEAISRWLGTSTDIDEHKRVLDAEGRDYRRRAFVPVDLNEVVAGVLLDLETRLAETSGRVEVLDLPTVASDPLQMRRLLQNLIANALKCHREGEAPVVRISAEICEGACRVSVADNGIGFDEKDLDTVFEMFQRLHGRGEFEGTGIGLAMCRRIVERHGGTITARSTLGQGATFIFTMPLFGRSL